ncbi:MAG: hypothetical protein IJY28_02115 [Clostridia bacterium]|nr:hypothetical protein [Clostridia bacterium]
MSFIKWDGIRSDELGVVVERYPALPGGGRIVNSVRIPGRNGELTEETGAFENYSQPYEVYVSSAEVNAPAAVRRMRLWLLRPTGYRRLEDSYDPDIYRRARCTASPDVANIMNRFGRATITFDCDPRRFLKEGEAVQELTEPAVLYNAYMTAQPDIWVYGSGAGTLTVGGCSVALDIANGYIHLDCENGNAEDPQGNANFRIHAPEMPVLPPGEVQITWTGGVERVEIQPHWWM